MLVPMVVALYSVISIETFPLEHATFRVIMRKLKRFLLLNLMDIACSSTWHEEASLTRFFHMTYNPLAKRVSKPNP
jgi:hypothetical protein